MYSPLPILSILLLFSRLTSATPTPLNAQRRQSTEPCAQLDPGSNVYTPSLVKACLQSIPFSEDVRQNVMSAVTALNTLNIFEYNQLSEDGPLAQNVDLHREFARISSSAYSSDYDFQNDLSRVLRSLHDGHYSWQSCYSQLFSTSHSIPITALRQNPNQGDPTIHLIPDLAAYVQASGLFDTYKAIGIDPDNLAGAQVMKINGQEVFQYLKEISAEDFGNYQDISQRLNGLMTSYMPALGNFAHNVGGFTYTNSLDKDNITLTVRPKVGDERDVVIPWLTSWGGSNPFDYSSGAAFFEANCILSPASGRSSDFGQSPETGSREPSSPIATGLSGDISNANNEDGAQLTLEGLTHLAYTQCPIVTDAAKYPYAKNPQSTANYLGGRDVQFYTLPESTVGVMYVSTFAPRDTSGVQADACIYRFVADVYYGLQNFTNAGVTKILIDTSNNGGGSITLTQLLQRFMTGEKYEIDINFETVLRDSPLSQGLLAAHLARSSEAQGSFGPDNYRNGTANLPDSTNYFTPGGQYEINGHTLYTSAPLEDGLGHVNDIDKVLNLSQNAPFAPTDIVFTGNGLCGSACSSFTNFLVEYFNATAYITSVQPSQPIEFHSFAAGQAVKSSDIYAEAASIGFADSTLLPALNVVGTFGFALRGALSPNISPGIFLQYRPYPAQRVYAPTEEMYLDPLANWAYVAKQAFGS